MLIGGALRSGRRAVLSFLLSFALSVGASRAEAPRPPAFEIAGSEVRTVSSSVSGRSYDLYVKLPRGYAAEENARRTYPVIFFNDGGYCWVTAAGATLPAFNFGAWEQAVLVGFSYAEGDGAVESRVRDFTPSRDEDWKLETGGARAYLDFIRDDAIPFIEAAYRVDAARRMLVGHSLGGLFGAFALIEEPGLFSDYVLTSPSLWFDDQVILELEEAAFAKGRVLAGRVYFATGEAETPSVVGRGHDMVSQQKAFATRLRARGHAKLDVRDEVLEGGTHLTVYPIGFTRAMRWLAPGPDIYNGGG